MSHRTTSPRNENLAGAGAALGLLLLAVLSCSCGTKEPILLGFVGGLSGRVADLGISGRNGALLAVEQRNAGGGLGGRKVELLVKDDAQDATTAVAADRELIDRGVAAIVGHMTSAMSTAAVHLMSSRRVLMMSPTTTSEFLTGQDDYFMRVSGTTRTYASQMARYLRRSKGLKVVAVVYDTGNQAYTESWVLEFRKEFERIRGRISRVETFRSGPEVPLHDVAERAVSQPAEGLVVVANAMDTAMLCQQLRKMGKTIPVAACEWAATEKLLELGGKAVEDITVSQFFDRGSTAPDFVAFRDAYRQRFGENPGFASVGAFDAVNVVLDALAQQSRGETLKEAVLRIRCFKGVQGELTIDPYGDGSRRTYITAVRDGRFEVVE